MDLTLLCVKRNASAVSQGGDFLKIIDAKWS